MAVNVTYRDNGAVVPSTTTVKGSPLANTEIDGNFKSVKDAVESLESTAVLTTGNQTIAGNKTFSGITKHAQTLMGDNTFVREYASGYSTTHTPTLPQEIGRMTFTGNFQNITIIGEIRGATGSLVGVNRFILDLRSETLPAKTFTLFEEEITNLGRLIRVRVYQDTASGLVVFGYSCDTQIQNIGWSLRIQERGNYNYLQQVTTLTALDTSGLTEVLPTTTVRTSSASISAPSFTSSVNTGTAPLTVTSTTQVNNLNADLLDGQHGSYYLNQDNQTNKPAIWARTFAFMGA
jgi:hypothetical protein